jgi:hypothetical protein
MWRVRVLWFALGIVATILWVVWDATGSLCCWGRSLPRPPD